MTFRLGLTGSIGMGKSATAALFAARGWPVWDADRAVHRLYASGGAAVAPVATAFPAALKDGGIDRAALRAAVTDDPEALKRLEAIVHPIVAADRAAFIAAAEAEGRAIAVLDIPLLYETGAEAALDGVAVVSTDAATQRARVLARPGMTPEMLDLVLARQLPDADKRARARWIIPTDTPEGAAAAVDQICAEILQGQSHAPDRP